MSVVNPRLLQAAVRARMSTVTGEDVTEPMYMDNPAQEGGDVSGYYKAIGEMRERKWLAEAKAAYAAARSGGGDAVAELAALERVKQAVRKKVARELKDMAPKNPSKAGLIDDPLFIMWLRGKEQLLNDPQVCPRGYEVIKGHSGYREVRDMEERKVLCREMRSLLFEIHSFGPDNETEVRTQWMFLVKPIHYALEVLHTHWLATDGPADYPTLYDLWGSTTGKLTKVNNKTYLAGVRHPKARGGEQVPWPLALTWSGRGPALYDGTNTEQPRIPVPLCQEVNPFMREFHIEASYKHWLDEGGPPKGKNNVGWYLWSLCGNRQRGAMRRLDWVEGGVLLKKQGEYETDEVLSTTANKDPVPDNYDNAEPIAGVGSARQSPEIANRDEAAAVAADDAADEDQGGGGGDAAAEPPAEPPRQPPRPPAKDQGRQEPPAQPPAKEKEPPAQPPAKEKEPPAQPTDQGRVTVEDDDEGERDDKEEQGAIEGPPATEQGAIKGPPATDQGAIKGPPATDQGAIEGPPARPAVTAGETSEQQVAQIPQTPTFPPSKVGQSAIAGPPETDQGALPAPPTRPALPAPATAADKNDEAMGEPQALLEASKAQTDEAKVAERAIEASDEQMNEAKAAERAIEASNEQKRDADVAARALPAPPADANDAAMGEPQAAIEASDEQKRDADVAARALPAPPPAEQRALQVRQKKSRTAELQLARRAGKNIMPSKFAGHGNRAFTDTFDRMASSYAYNPQAHSAYLEAANPEPSEASRALMKRPEPAAVSPLEMVNNLSAELMGLPDYAKPDASVASVMSSFMQSAYAHTLIDKLGSATGGLAAIEAQKSLDMVPHSGGGELVPLENHRQLEERVFEMDQQLADWVKQMSAGDQSQAWLRSAAEESEILNVIEYLNMANQMFEASAVGGLAPIDKDAVRRRAIADTNDVAAALNMASELDPGVDVAEPRGKKAAKRDKGSDQFKASLIQALSRSPAAERITRLEALQLAAHYTDYLMQMKKARQFAIQQ